MTNQTNIHNQGIHLAETQTSFPPDLSDLCHPRYIAGSGRNSNALQLYIKSRRRRHY